jgi:uncharacterized membrane protein YedE/YeeE
MKLITALLAGALFGSGLLLSGMLDPSNVIGFLDLFGEWRPQLALVMGAGIVIAAPAFLFVRAHGRNLTGQTTELPDRRRIDFPLLAGAATFGVGWGLGGICPGPGIALLSTGSGLILWFVAAMFAGMLVVFALRSRRTLQA